MISEKFEKPYDPKNVEDKIYKLWEKSGYFNPDNLPIVKGQRSKVKGQFTICLPPPNVTGSLHMGHALNATIQDILIRKKRIEGYKTLWIPGTDHAGIATQNVVEKQLKKEGISRHQLGREKFLEKVWEWKAKYGDIILSQLKKIGASCDWSRAAFTMDENYSIAVREAFNHYYKKGWIYQGERIVNWCPRCGTSLSDLELEYEEEKGKLWHICYPVKGQMSKVKSQEYIVVATTRPETMLGDSAVAVNPKDERYKDFVGKNVILPIQNREIPIISDITIDKDFGTGAVKVTPAHDFTDAEIGERHNLPIIKIIDERGKMTEKAGEAFVGLKILECREKVLEQLKELGLLEKEEDYTHSVAKCYRCGGTVEPLPSLQWFLKMGELAKLAIKAVKSGKVKFYPQRWEKVYLDWLSKVKDWCISRQIWWGHQLPVFFCAKKQEKFKIKNLKLKIDEEKFIISLKKPNKCPFCGKCQMAQSEDVLDTWFSSALWPFATLGWPSACGEVKSEKLKVKSCEPKAGTDLAEFYPTQVLSTARDIINLWVGRMIFSGEEFMKEAPFSDVIIHATILTKDGKRMSKSLGTGIDPMTLIEKYGADATRFGLIWQSMGGQDVHWAEEHVMAGKKFANKLWNITRFVLQNGNPKHEAQNPKEFSNLTNEDKKILGKLEQTKNSVNKDINGYNFGQALHTLYDFIWHDFADVYLEESKKQLTTDDQRQTTQKILYHSLLEILKMLHPFMPFVTEEIYQNLPKKDAKFLMVDKVD